MAIRMLAAALATALAGCGTAYAAQSAPEPVRELLAAYEAAWEAKDARALAALFDEEGYVLANGQDPARGREAIEAMYAGQGGPLELTPLAWRLGDDIGFVLGTFEAGETGSYKGKFTLTLTRSPQGDWRIFSDMDNPSAAPARMAAPPPIPDPAPEPPPDR